MSNGICGWLLVTKPASEQYKLAGEEELWVLPLLLLPLLLLPSLSEMSLLGHKFCNGIVTVLHFVATPFGKDSLSYIHTHPARTSSSISEVTGRSRRRLRLHRCFIVLVGQVSVRGLIHSKADAEVLQESGGGGGGNGDHKKRACPAVVLLSCCGGWSVNN